MCSSCKNCVCTGNDVKLNVQHSHQKSDISHLLLQDVADSCKTGAATDIIFGLALGYKSAIIPCIVIAVCIFVSFTLAHMYGIACAALGMLTTLSTGKYADMCLLERECMLGVLACKFV